MLTVAYDNSAHMFRRYEPWECDEDGYPFIWPKISEVRSAERCWRCDECGFAYLEDGDILTVHHFNPVKADCRKENLKVYCWLHHSQDHEPDTNVRAAKCKICKDYFGGWPRLRRHIRGIHRPSELKIPEIMLDQRPSSYVSRGKRLAAIQEQERLWRLWRD
jgi:hypothetical protein